MYFGTKNLPRRQAQTYPQHNRAWPAGHQINGLDAGCTGIDNARDKEVVEVVDEEWGLQQVSDIQLTV